MKYTVTAKASGKDEGTIQTGGNQINFGVSKKNTLPTPADLLVASFAACCLKNVERFSEFLHYEYTGSEIRVEATRSDAPPMIEAISFVLTIRSRTEKINTDLLLRNLQKYGTIYNTLNKVCRIEGEIIVEK